MQYLALLRGVNVGGNNLIAMPKLKAALEQHGFSDVCTYINSGNVLFETPKSDLAQLQAACRQIILKTFNLDIAIAILPAEALLQALAEKPDWWNRDADTKHNAIFVIAPYDAQAINAKIGAIKPEYEAIAICGQIIFWSAPLKTFHHARWAQVIGTYSKQVTIRNANTTLKLAQLIQAQN